MFHPHYISTFQIYLMDYPGQGFIKLKYSDASTPIIQRDQSHLDPHTDFTSTWLYPVVFRHCIKNLSSSAPKHSELLANHYDDFRSEGHLYLYFASSTWQQNAQQVSHLFSDDVSLHLTCMPYQCHHTPWLREQPTHMAHNDLYSINIIILYEEKWIVQSIYF